MRSYTAEFRMVSTNNELLQQCKAANCTAVHTVCVLAFSKQMMMMMMMMMMMVVVVVVVVVVIMMVVVMMWWW